MSIGTPKPTEAESTVKSKGGRPSVGDQKLVKKTVSLTEAQWTWLRLFWSGDPEQDTPAHHLRELLEWARLFWPKGPRVFGKVGKQPRYRMPSALAAFAKEQGLTNKEAAALIVQQHFAEKKSN